MAVKIFFCYAHEDEALLKQLKRHLRPLQRQGLIELWHDRDISAGTPWKSEIDKNLHTAQIILLLISPDFMESEYCYSVEMQKAIERHKMGKATVIPVILRHIYWQVELLGELQALPTDAKPVTDPEWHSLDRALFNIAEGIHKKVKELVATELQAAAEKKQLALDLFNKQFTEACLADNDPAIVAAYNIIQTSSYAKYYILDRHLRNRLEIAQERVEALTALRTVFARKNVLEIGNEFKLRRDILKYLTDEEWGILTIAAIVTEIYATVSNEDIQDLEALKEDFVKKVKEESEYLESTIEENLKALQYLKISQCFAMKYAYEQIQSSPYKNMLLFTEQEEQHILLIKQYVDYLEKELSVGDDEIEIESEEILKDVAEKAFEALYVKRVCPYCIKEFYPGDCRIVSGVRSSYGNEILKDAPKGIEKLRRRIYPEPLTGSAYTLEQARRACLHCDAHLPYNIERVENVTIVVLGDTFSGQTTYFAALLHEIQMEWIPKNNGYMHVHCLTENVEREFHQDLTYPLFESKDVLSATFPSSSNICVPLIYELKLSALPSLPIKTVNLIFYHGNGGDYAIQERLVNYSRYVFNASGIIYIADPEAMPEIENQFPAQYDRKLLTGRSASDVLSLLVHLFEHQFGTEPESLLCSIPIAVTLSKSDLLKHLEPSNGPYSFLRDPKNGYSNGVDLQDLKIVDDEVRKITHEYGDRMLLKLASRLNAQFFAVSATGCAPDENGCYPAVEPRRCLDPFLWILYQLNILPGDEG